MKEKPKRPSTFSAFVKDLRDDIEDGKLDKEIKEAKEKDPLLFQKAGMIGKITIQVIDSNSQPLPPANEENKTQ